jgi:hypothetical protein
VERAERVTESLESLPGLTVCGALFDGIDVGSCLRRAERSASLVAQHLTSDGRWHRG